VKVLVDPYVIVIPPVHSTEHEVSSYVEGMEIWIDVASMPSVNVFYSSDYLSKLMETDQFPFVHKLYKLFSNAGITQYDAHTVARLFMSLFDSWKDIEDNLYVERITCQVKVKPRAFIERMISDVCVPFLHCLCRIVLQQRSGDSALDHLCVGSRSAPDKNATKLTVEAVVTNIEIREASRASQFAHEHWPAKIGSELMVLLDREHVLTFIDWAAIWASPKLAVEKAYYSVLSPSDRSRFILTDFRVGERFLDTIVNLGLHTQIGRIRSIYETCALVICGYVPRVPGINPRPLRRSIRETDGAKGMRADISQEHAGYRLHFWRQLDGLVELSCVNVHNDVTIY
jgi:hypothetical protein